MLSPEFKDCLRLRMNGEEKQDASIILPDSDDILTSQLDEKKNDKKNDETAEIKFFITPYNKCLVAVPYHDWLIIENQFEKVNSLSSPVLFNFKRLFIGSVEEHIIDSQGRILLSQDHREYAKIEKEVRIVGLTNRFEIWNPELYNQTIEAINFENLSTEMSSSGINFFL